MFKSWRTCSIVGAALAAACAVTVVAQSAQSTGAEMILKNGHVYTVDAGRNWVQAVAVKDGRIVHVGTDASMGELQSPQTRVIDLGGRMVLPGFVDTHNHAYLRAEAMFWVTYTTPSLDAYKAATQAFLAKHPDAKQLRGVGFNLNMVINAAAAAKRSPRELLDDIVGRDVPAAIITNGHHQIWANTKAIHNAKLTRQTPDPPGGVIDRDGAGEPNGIFREFGAQNLILQALPQPDFTVEEFKQAIQSFQRDLAAERGVTSATVPVHYPSDNFLAAMQALDNESKLTLRYDLLLWANETRGTEQLAELIARRDKYKGKLFKIDSIKIFGTGVSNPPMMVWEQAALRNMVAAADKVGFRVYVHVIGRTDHYALVLDAFEYARQQNGARDARHAITHVGASASPLAARFKALDIDADGHPTPTAFFEEGARVTISSDYPSYAAPRDFFPLARIATGVRNGVSLDAMLAAHTINGAHLIFAETETGSIELGKAADLVVLDENLFGVPLGRLETVRTAMTVFNGKEVFRDPSFAAGK